MKHRKCLFMFLAAIVVFILFFIYRVQTVLSLSRNNFNNNKFQLNQHLEIVIVAVACNERQPETLNMIKSAILFNYNELLRFIIITEKHLMSGFKEKLGDWQAITKVPFKFDILPLTFPIDNQKEWKNLFKPCASQRLFLPSMLKDVDSIIYMDADTLFLSPVLELWKFFSLFNSSQIAALSPEHEDKNVGWYNRFAKHPYYGEQGVNSGVMLMNLTRMRMFNWEDNILPIYKDYRLKITWGDQDLINILFYFHSDKLFVFKCEWNYRPDHCMYMSVCKSPSGIKIIHGNRGYFHSNKQPAFSALYNTFQDFRLGSDSHQLLLALEASLDDISVKTSNCGKVSDKMLYKARQIFTETNYSYPM